MSLAVNVELENNPQYGVVVSSRKVAEGLNKRHDHVMRDLDGILHSSNMRSDHSPDLGGAIIPVKYTAKNKQQYREYLLTKDGFTLYMFNIQGYNDFKWAYIQKFNEMEAALANVSKPVQQHLPMEKPMPVRKTWNGLLVMTMKDVEQLTNSSQSEVHYWLDHCFACGVLLTGDHLARFKRENNMHSYTSKLIVLYRHDVEAILAKSGINGEFQSLLDEYFIPDHALGNGDMRYAVKQADLLYKIAREIKDPVVKEVNLKAITALLIDIGLWNDKHAGFNGVTSNWDGNTVEGWNKGCALHEAKRYWPME